MCSYVHLPPDLSDFGTRNPNTPFSLGLGFRAWGSKHPKP